MRRTLWCLVSLGPLAIYACNADQFSGNDGGNDTGLDSDVIVSGGDDGAQGEAGCGNVQSDRNNCGVCGHSCLGGDCDAGVCQPLLIGTLSHTIFSLAIDATNVYVGAEDVYTCAKATCAANKLTAITAPPNFINNIVQQNVMAIGTETRSNVPWIVYMNYGALSSGINGYVGACPATGCPDGGSGHIFDMPHASTVAVTAATTYVASNAVVEAFPTSGGSPVQFAGGTSLTSIAADDLGNFAYADKYTGAGVFTCSQTSCAPIVQLYTINGSYLNFTAPQMVALHGGVAYWANESGLIESCEVGGCGNSPTNVVTQTGTRLGDFAITATGQLFYLINYTGSPPAGTPGTGSIVTCSLPNCSTTTAIVKNRNYPFRIAVTPEAIYWVEGVIVDNTAPSGPFEVYRLAR